MSRLENYKIVVRKTDQVLHTAGTEAEMMKWISENCSIRDHDGNFVYCVTGTDDEIVLRRTYTFR